MAAYGVRRLPASLDAGCLETTGTWAIVISISGSCSRGSWTTNWSVHLEEMS